MSNTEYSTDKANYRQIYAVHNIPVRDEIFEDKNFDSADGLILEAYHTEEWFDLLWKSEFKKHYDKIFDAVQRTEKPTYIVDVLTTAGGRGFETLTSIGTDLLGLIGIYDGIKKVSKQIKDKEEMTKRQFLKFWGVQTAKIVGGTYLDLNLVCRNYPIQTADNPEFLARLNSSRMHLVPTPQFELRNAISARKIEEYVAPELTEQLGRKPNIVLLYGAGHSGLKEDLQYQSLRNFYIDIYSMLGFPGIDTTHLDTVTNISIDQQGNYALMRRKTNLFYDNSCRRHD